MLKDAVDWYHTPVRLHRYKSASCAKDLTCTINAHRYSERRSLWAAPLFFTDSYSGKNTETRFQ